MNSNIKFMARWHTLSRRVRYLLPVLALLTVIAVFWWLKLTAVTMAGDAFCGYEEHIHNDECSAVFTDCTIDHSHGAECCRTELVCGYEEHIHTAECYSDINADLEISEDWEATLPDTENMTTGQRITAIASSQIGYSESLLNFYVDDMGVRHGYTRYGEWYGNPYGAWSNMFTSFCLRYAGLEDIPIGAGADTMLLSWRDAGLYRELSEYTPISGDILFLDKNGNSTADATAIILDMTPEGYTVIEGDVDNAVTGNTYACDDPAVIGYGAACPRDNLQIVEIQPEDNTEIGENTVTEESEAPESPEQNPTKETERVPMLSTSPMASDTAEDDGVSAQALTYIAKTTGYSQNMFNDTDSYVIYTQSGENYYAFDGNGNAVRIYIDAQGNITADVADPNILLWTFTYQSSNTYLIRNASSGKYMHAFANNGGGVTTTGAYSSTLISYGSGARVRSNNEYARLDTNQGKFVLTQTQSQSAVYSFGVVSKCTVWLDGTDGGIMALSGAQDKSYSLLSGESIILPQQWQAPPKYNYTLRGWYDVKNGRYYPPGAQVTVTENLVFYADWVAASYDLGQFNSFVSDTVSTNDFVTTKVFDYSVLFNVMSQVPAVNVNSSGHSETWSMLHSGYVPYNNMSTLDFSFIDYDANGDISYANGRDDRNISKNVYSGLYNSSLGYLLFGTDNSFDPQTGNGVIGKSYLGTADHLFQLMTDRSDPNYGYYYYDSKLNAASYNQSENRFYVYDYLERTADSEKDGGAGGYSDFLPFNSPYANTNGKRIVNYTYQGEKNEYQGVTHYQYDAKYNTNNNSTDNVATNYAFGMSIDIEFYLPNTPGDQSGGSYGNLDVNGNEMHFKFSGDDDVWVLLDGELVLDIGGVHGIESGDINFSTGVITINGTQVGTLDGVTDCEHTLTVHYLERGSSQSNCAIYFNLAPRFSFSIRKEDVLTQDVLNGAQFSVYTDRDCTQPAQLWTSKESHDAGEQAANTFTVVDGVANMWGMSAGRVYYIKETRPPDNEDYGMPNGIISVSLDKRGIASYAVEMIEDTDGSTPSKGFTVHGFRIDEETQNAYIVATNAPKWVQEVTSVEVRKKWDDTKSHSGQSVTVYLTVTDPDGTVRRIREIELNDDNDWHYVWDNLPKNAEDGSEIVYGVGEGYTSGYFSKVDKVDSYNTVTEAWVSANTLQNAQTYIIGSSSGYLSTQNTTGDTGFIWITEEEAKASPQALWTVTTSNQTYKLTNGIGQTLTFYYNGGSSGYPTDFFASGAGENDTSKQYMKYQSFTNGLRLYYDGADGRDYYLVSSMTDSQKFRYSTTQSDGLILMPKLKTVTGQQYPPEADSSYLVTNIPLDTDNETSLAVTKKWDPGMSGEADYQQEQITLKLLANGSDTGRTITLSLKNNWRGSFMGLPYKDDNGNIIAYTVVESSSNEDWLASYGDVIQKPGTPPTYEVEVTNTYRWGHGYQLPETGGGGPEIWILSGLAIMLAALIYGYLLRRRQKGGGKTN